MKQKQTIFTPAQFADKVKISRATVWRWLNNRHLRKRFKMHDAQPIKIAGKDFIELT
jgi:hypothetical protein